MRILYQDAQIFMRSIFKSFGTIAFLPYPKILCFPLFLRPVRDRAFA